MNFSDHLNECSKKVKRVIKPTVLYTVTYYITQNCFNMKVSFYTWGG